MGPTDTTRSDQPAPEGWQTLRRFLPYLWPADRTDLRIRIVLALLLVLVAKGTTLALPYAYRAAVDAMETPANTAAMVAISFVVAYAAGRFASVAFDNVRNMIFERVGQDATRQFAEDVFQRLHQLSLRFHLSRRTGEVTKTVERGTKSIDTMLYFLLFNIAPTVIELIAVAVIFYLNFGIGLVIATAVTVIAYIAVTQIITEWRTKLRREMNDLDGQALARAVDSLLNYETVKYFGAEAREHARYAKAARQYSEAAIKSDGSLGLLNIAQAFIMNLLMAGAMGYTVWGWSRGDLTTGDLVFVNTYLTQLFRPLDMLGFVYRTIRQGLIDMAAMFRLVDADVEVEDVPGAPALHIERPGIVFENVHFGYEPDRSILHGLDFEIAAGETVALVGPSGAGKSTLFMLAQRFYDPEEGTIRLDGIALPSADPAEIRERMAFVPQIGTLFSGNARDNLRYGRWDASDEEIWDAARLANAADFIEALPQGLDTNLGEDGTRLSGGQQQRLAIARAILRDSPILLLDEATSALDAQSERLVQEALGHVMRGRTTLVIAHRLATVREADRIVVMDGGRIVQQGTHSELVARGGLYAQLAKLQFDAPRSDTA